VSDLDSIDFSPRPEVVKRELKAVEAVYPSWCSPCTSPIHVGLDAAGWVHEECA
jgi:hypothetical protein